jgi:hypothetical protein
MVATKRIETKVVTPGDPPWVKALFLAPAVLGSFCALVLLGQSRSVRHALRRLMGRPSPATPSGALDAVRARIVGQDRRRITTLFGPPPASTSAPSVTWYYPVRAAARTAMAISFEDDTATRVEFFRSPE